MFLYNFLKAVGTKFYVNYDIGILSHPCHLYFNNVMFAAIILNIGRVAVFIIAYRSVLLTVAGKKCGCGCLHLHIRNVLLSISYYTQQYQRKWATSEVINSPGGTYHM